LFVICAGVDGDADADEVAPGTENLVAPGAESSLTSQVISLGEGVLPSCGKIRSSLSLCLDRWENYCIEATIVYCLC